MVLKDKTFSRDHFASLILTISGVVLVAFDGNYFPTLHVCPFLYSTTTTTTQENTVVPIKVARVSGSVMIVLAAAFSYAVYVMKSHSHH